MNREFYQLKNVDPEDINDVLLKVQRSFDIRFDQSELDHVATFGDLCDAIQNKISLLHEDTCTTQHAFYLLRNAIAAATGADKCSVKPHSRLGKLFPRENRLEGIACVEQELGFKIDLLQPKQWIVTSFALILLASSIAFFYNWEIALGGCLASLLGLKLAGKFGKEIHLKTVGDLANKISRESNVKAKRNPTVTRNEIEQKVHEVLAQKLQLEPVVLTRRSRF